MTRKLCPIEVHVSGDTGSWDGANHYVVTAMTVEDEESSYASLEKSGFFERPMTVKLWFKGNGKTILARTEPAESDDGRRRR